MTLLVSESILVQHIARCVVEIRLKLVKYPTRVGTQSDEIEDKRYRFAFVLKSASSYQPDLDSNLEEVEDMMNEWVHERTDAEGPGFCICSQPPTL